MRSTGQDGVELLPVADRFYFNQYFPISDKMLTEEFLNTHVDSLAKRDHLKDLSKKKSELVGILGR